MLYNIDELVSIKKEVKKGKILLIVLSSLTLCLLICFSVITRLRFLKCKNVNAFLYLMLALLLIFGWLFLYILFGIVLENKKKIKILNQINSAEKSNYEGEVVEIGKTITINKYETAILVSFKVDKKILSFYYSNYIGECKLLENKRYSITVANGRIIDYKEFE